MQIDFIILRMDFVLVGITGEEDELILDSRRLFILLDNDRHKKT